MKYNPDIHRRRSIRLKGYDYSRPGAYFVTICVNRRECLLGQIVNGRMYLNDAGIMIRDTWQQLPEYYNGFTLDQFVIMPNHIHGIIVINNNSVGAAPCGRPVCSGDDAVFLNEISQQARTGQARGPAPTGDNLALPQIIHRFKTLTTKRYADGVKNNNWPRFHRRLWQRNYHEHIIRNERRLDTIRRYILYNPLKWELDIENPNHIPITEKRKFWKIFLDL
ncbi:hypothetical protein DENIS_0342 [Desulfonema ishimotonii]|uniref:Transposase IS200-like domain-containing protein n=2 Tax=Desulfonema ishimotonii TaxID=45657 RepID=A0A401FR17_9BACT|nr:hypothetical protein DENIS_0342 [Desulfonema ishimotonii]